MSDTYGSEAGQPAKAEPTPSEEKASEIFHKSVTFDKVPMQKPADAGILDAEALVDPATLPEYMPPLDNTTLPPPEHRYPRQEEIAQAADTNRSWRKPVFGVIAAAALGLAAYAAGSRSGDKEPVSAGPDREVTTTDVPATTETTLEETTTTESLKPVEEGVLITGNTPDDVMSKFAQDVECIFGTRNYTSQQNCLQKIMGDRVGDLRDEYLRYIEEVDNYVLNNPGSKYDNYFFEYLIVDSKIVYNKMIIVANINDTGGNNTQRYTFEKTFVMIESAEAVPEQTEAWILTAVDTLEPGEVTFE